MIAVLLVIGALAPAPPGGGGGATAPRPPESLPYRLWWSFPRDDVSAIEIDDPDLHVSRFTSRWQFVREMQRCDPRRGTRLLKRRDQSGDGTPLREVRIESLDDAGEVRATTRCVMRLVDWRARLGERLIERLDDELDAHVSFLLPRKRPSPPPAGDPHAP